MNQLTITPSIIIGLIIYLSCNVYAQDNCNVFLWQGDTCKYDACKYLEEAPSWYQLTKEYHIIKDKAIEICPNYATAYKHKSTGYLKTGDFINFKKLIDKAVDLDPINNLGYRGWCRFQFFRDYKGAIEDIERFEGLIKGDIGYCQNGDYHLVIAKALCYKMIGERKKAIELMITQINMDTVHVGLYDYLHLGVLYLEDQQYEKALKVFQNQSIENELAENQFYLAKLYKSLGKNKLFIESMEKAEDLYHSKTYMYDVYTTPIDKIYLEDITNAINQTMTIPAK